jgi:tetratricopeptide (TPR) repeat protein
MLLEATLTPTPLYVNTPHPRTEAFKSGMRAYANQEWDDLLAYMEQAATVEPDAPDILYYVGEAFRNKEYDLQAIKSYNQALTRDGTFAPAFLGLGLTYMYGMDQWENARDNFKLAIKNDPLMLDAYLELALLYLNQNNGQTALDYITLAEKAGLSSPFLPLYRARALLLLDQPDEALEAALTANQMDPTHLESYRVLGQAYLAAGQIGEAVDTLTIYLARAPEDAEATTWLGLAYEERGQQSLALKTYTQAITLDAKQAPALLQRGLIYFEQEENEKAKADLQKYLALNKESFLANMTLGRAHLLLGEDGNAYQQFSICEAYAKTDEDWAQIYYYRAQALENLGQTDVARKNWSNLLKLPADTYPEEWKDTAEVRLGRAATFTRTPTLTRTATPFRTSTRTPTRQPTATATPKP